jgi:hypothetical protein
MKKRIYRPPANKDKERERVTKRTKLDSAETQKTAIYKSHRYTPEEVEFIRENKRTMTAVDIAKNLGRTFMGIKNQARKKGISLVSRAKQRGRIISQHKRGE